MADSEEKITHYCKEKNKYFSDEHERHEGQEKKETTKTAV